MTWQLFFLKIMSARVYTHYKGLNSVTPCQSVKAQAQHSSWSGDVAKVPLSNSWA